jgi:hypothetical protein
MRLIKIKASAMSKKKKIATRQKRPVTRKKDNTILVPIDYAALLKMIGLYKYSVLLYGAH